MNSLIENITKETTPPEMVKIYQDYLTNNATLKELYEYHKNTQISFMENITSTEQSRTYFEETIHTANSASKLIGLGTMMETEFYRAISLTEGTESIEMKKIKKDILESMGEKIDEKTGFRLWRIKEILLTAESVLLNDKKAAGIYFSIFNLALRELLALGFTEFDELKMRPIMGTNDISSLSYRIEREYVAQFNNYYGVANHIEKLVMGIVSMNDNYDIHEETRQILGNIFRSTVNEKEILYPDLQKFTRSKHI